MNFQNIKTTTLKCINLCYNNIISADKTTLWFVIGLLSLSIFTNKPNDVPLSPTTDKKAEILKTSQIKVIKNPASKQLQDNTKIELDLSNKEFKFCYSLEAHTPDNPFEQIKSNEPVYVFVLDEKTNNKGETYIKSVLWTDYKEEDIKTETNFLYKDATKVKCTDSIIENSKLKDLI